MIPCLQCDMKEFCLKENRCAKEGQMKFSYVCIKESSFGKFEDAINCYASSGYRIINGSFFLEKRGGDFCYVTIMEREENYAAQP